MYQTKKLQDRIVQKYGSQNAFAKAIGMDRTTLNKLIGEGREWKASTMMKAVDLLDIPATEIKSYFFTPAVEELQPQGK